MLVVTPSLTDACWFFDVAKSVHAGIPNPPNCGIIAASVGLVELETNLTKVL
jgi:hypothetical protein